MTLCNHWDEDQQRTGKPRHYIKLNRQTRYIQQHTHWIIPNKPSPARSEIPLKTSPYTIMEKGRTCARKKSPLRLSRFSLRRRELAREGGRLQARARSGGNIDHDVVVEGGGVCAPFLPSALLPLPTLPRRALLAYTPARAHVYIYVYGTAQGVQ